MRIINILWMPLIAQTVPRIEDKMYEHIEAFPKSVRATAAFLTHQGSASDQLTPYVSHECKNTSKIQIKIEALTLNIDVDSRMKGYQRNSAVD